MALDLGAVDLLSEPFDPEELALRLTTQLARKRQADRLRRRVSDGLQAAVTDPLTGLHNRRYALSHLKRVRERALALGKSFAVMVVDLDRFKRVNDIYGHAAGDAVICAVAERLKANVRSVDLISRIGGEEFLVILPDIQTGPARKAAERLCKAVESSPIAIDMPEEEGEEVAVKSVAADGGQTPFVLPKKNTQRSFFEREVLITQTVSIGLAMGGVGPGAEVEPDSAVVERADKALYLSKNNGRNQVTVGRSSAAA